MSSEQAYAIIQTGGKQYRVTPDDVIDVELIDAEPGAAVEFSEVLFLQDGKKALVGAPILSGHKVKGELLSIAAGEKVTSVKYVKRKGNRRKWGHRQKYSRVLITDIGVEVKKSEKKAEPKAKKAAPKADAQPKAAAKKETKPKAKAKKAE